MDNENLIGREIYITDKVSAFYKQIGVITNNNTNIGKSGHHDQLERHKTRELSPGQLRSVNTKPRSQMMFSVCFQATRNHVTAKPADKEPTAGQHVSHYRLC